MLKCIYCKINKNPNDFNNREHIIPQAFGHFQPKNLILNDRESKDKTVCNNCNAKFGRELEIYLANDSYEGYILRSKFQGKTSKQKRRSRIVLRIAEGDYKGVYVELSENQTLELSPQIGLQRKNDTWDYFLLDEISNIHINNYNLGKESLRYFAIDDLTQVFKVFNKIGIKFVKEGGLPPPTAAKNVLCKIETIVDEIIHRSIAKIAFNYFAYFNSKEVMLNDKFDGVRNFILNGEGQVPINLSGKPILFDEQKFGRLGHIVTINTNNRGDLISQVSLFNHITYTVLLATQVKNEQLKYGFGHYFDINSKKIIKVYKSTLIIPEIRRYTPGV